MKKEEDIKITIEMASSINGLIATPDGKRRLSIRAWLRNNA